MRQVIKLRKMDKAQRDEAEALLDLYMDAVESQPDMFDRETGEIVENVLSWGDIENIRVVISEADALPTIIYSES